MYHKNVVMTFSTFDVFRLHSQ